MWDNTVIVIDEGSVLRDATVEAGISGVSDEDGYDIKLVGIGTHEAIHTVQNSNEFHVKHKDPKTGKFIKPKQGSDLIPIDDRKQEQEGKKVGGQAEEELRDKRINQ